MFLPYQLFLSRVGARKTRLTSNPHYSQGFSNERGAILTVSLAFLVVLALLGTTAAKISIINTQIGGYYKTITQVFNKAEAGTGEARERLRGDAFAPISDTQPTQNGWRVYIGDATKAQEQGYDPNDAMHERTDSRQDTLDYLVEIKHATDVNDNVLYWNGTTRTTVPGQNIYVITSYGALQSATRSVQLEASRIPPMDVPGALYVEATTNISGSSTDIIGVDDCGNDDKPGIVITLEEADDPINQHGNPDITGTPDIVYAGGDLDVQTMVDGLKKFADFAYTVEGDTHTGNETPGPGDGWGTPTPGADLEHASSCSEYNIVHYNTNDTHIRLSGGVSGCGMLLIEGDAIMHGGFSWYGPILITGSLTYSGGGNKQVTGAVLSGGSVDANVAGGNSNIVFCSAAVNTSQFLPLRVLSWREL